MKDKILQAIKDIIHEKRCEGDVLPYAHSIEVAHRLKMNIRQVEKMANEIEDMVIHKTINGECYEI